MWSRQEFPLGLSWSKKESWAPSPTCLCAPGRDAVVQAEAAAALGLFSGGKITLAL